MQWGVRERWCVCACVWHGGGGHPPPSKQQRPAASSAKGVCRQPEGHRHAPEASTALRMSPPPLPGNSSFVTCTQSCRAWVGDECACLCAHRGTRSTTCRASNCDKHLMPARQHLVPAREGGSAKLHGHTSALVTPCQGCDKVGVSWWPALCLPVLAALPTGQTSQGRPLDALALQAKVLPPHALSLHVCQWCC